MISSSGRRPLGFNYSNKSPLEWTSSDSNDDVTDWLSAMKDKLKNAHNALKQTGDELEIERALTLRMLSIMRRVEEEGWFLVIAKCDEAAPNEFLGTLERDTFKTAVMGGYDGCVMGAFKHQNDAAAFALLFK